MKKQVLTAALLMGAVIANAQVGVGTLDPNASAQLDVVADNKGILIPRVSLTSITDTTTITNGNVASLLVYNLNDNDSVKPGFYYWYEGEWRKLLVADDVNSDVLTVLSYDSTTDTLSYVDENKVKHDFVLNNTKNSTIVLNGTTLIITDTDGVAIPVDLSGLDTNTKNVSLTLNTSNVLTLTDTDLVPLTVDLTPLTNSTKITAGTNVTITGTGSVATPYVVNADNTTIQSINFDSVTNNITITDSEGTVSNPIDISGVLKAKNGLNVTADKHVALGGNLTENTTIATAPGSSNFDLNITGLPQTDTADGSKIMMVDNTTGKLRVADSKQIVQNVQKTATVVDGTNTTVSSTITGDNTEYKVNVPTASATDLGVVKQAATNPTVFISNTGELSIQKDWQTNSFVEVSTNYTATIDDTVVFGKANTNNDILITLPDPTNIKGKKITIKKSDIDNDTYVNVVSAGNATIEGEPDLYTSLPYTGWDLMSDGTNWKIVNKF